MQRPRLVLAALAVTALLLAVLLAGWLGRGPMSGHVPGGASYQKVRLTDGAVPTGPTLPSPPLPTGAADALRGGPAT